MTLVMLSKAWGNHAQHAAVNVKPAQAARLVAEGIAFKCDACDEPATSVARDMIRATRPGDVYEHYEPADQLKLGCADHPARSVEIDRC